MGFCFLEGMDGLVLGFYFEAICNSLHRRIKEGCHVGICRGGWWLAGFQFGFPFQLRLHTRSGFNWHIGSRPHCPRRSNERILGGSHNLFNRINSVSIFQRVATHLKGAAYDPQITEPHLSRITLIPPCRVEETGKYPHNRTQTLKCWNPTKAWKVSQEVGGYENGNSYEIS